MKRFLVFIASFFAGIPCLFAGNAAAFPDSVKLARLDSMLTVYVAAMSGESIESKESECDFLINSPADTAVRRHIALKLFDNFKDAEIMGDEAVAIYLYDKYFEPGVFSMRSDVDRMDAEIFAKFNRSTLLGMQAPEITLRSPCGCRKTIPANRRYSVLFFYDTSCAKCKLEAQLLPSALGKADFKIDLYAVCCDKDRKDWREFRRSLKRVKGVRTTHLWDPESESGFLMKYGVIATPRLYLTTPDGTIIGRRLEVENLESLISLLNEVQSISSPAL